MAKELTSETMGEIYGAGLSCSMAVFGELAEQVGLDVETARKIAGAFGGSFTKHSVCGCVSGARMALGLKYSGSQPGCVEQQQLLRKKVKEFEDIFADEFGSIICTDMLGGLDTTDPSDKKLIAERNLSQSVCREAICFAINTVSRMLEEDDDL